MKEKNIQFYTVPELAEILRVHTNTIYQAIRCGRIQAFRAGSGKRATLRIYKTEIERMMAFDTNIIVNEMAQTMMVKAIKKATAQLYINEKTKKALDDIITNMESQTCE